MYVTDLRTTERLPLMEPQTPVCTTGINDGATDIPTVQWIIADKHGAPNFEMRYFHLPAKTATEWHEHPWEHEVFIVSGKGAVRRSDRGAEEYTDIEAGSAVFVTPGEKHQFRAADNQNLDFICVVPRGRTACTVAAR